MNSLFLLAALLAPDGTLSLDEAIEQALTNHPKLEELAAAEKQADAQHHGARANYGPKLRLEANAILWNDNHALDLGLGGAAAAASQLPPPATYYEGAELQLFQTLGEKGVLELREQVTTSVKLQLIQPLLSLWTVYQASDLTALGVDAAKLETEVARELLAATVTEAYLRVLQAQAMEAAAQRSLENLQAQRDKVKALEEAGILGRNDSLKLEVAVADAQNQVLQSANTTQIARSGLMTAMGARDPIEGEISKELPSWLEEDPPSREAAYARALEKRQELSLVRKKVEQAERAVSYAKGDHMPSLNLVAQYEHTTGSQMTAENSAFIGALFSTTLFEWGATESKVDQARAQVARAQAAMGTYEQSIRFEVDRAWIESETASERIAVAEAAVAQAEEALRLEQARLEVQQATSSDVLSTEAALTRSEVNLEAARYERLVARARLRRAMGEHFH